MLRITTPPPGRRRTRSPCRAYSVRPTTATATGMTGRPPPRCSSGRGRTGTSTDRRRRSSSRPIPQSITAAIRSSILRGFRRSRVGSKHSITTIAGTAAASKSRSSEATTTSHEGWTRTWAGVLRRRRWRTRTARPSRSSRTRRGRTLIIEAFDRGEAPWHHRPRIAVRGGSRPHPMGPAQQLRPSRRPPTSRLGRRARRSPPRSRALRSWT
mmetsp:Transcript_29139/g.86238  ORF Transcript_29139/g.86238 Transcript_29139/m.86238 type:complete len:212 (+) Transcript_29139:976-1611(+)